MMMVMKGWALLSIEVSDLAKSKLPALMACKDKPTNKQRCLVSSLQITKPLGFRFGVAGSGDRCVSRELVLFGLCVCGAI